MSLLNCAELNRRDVEWRCVVVVVVDMIFINGFAHTHVNGDTRH